MSHIISVKCTNIRLRLEEAACPVLMLMVIVSVSLHTEINTIRPKVHPVHYMPADVTRSRSVLAQRETTSCLTVTELQNKYDTRPRCWMEPNSFREESGAGEAGCTGPAGEMNLFYTFMTR